MAIPYFLGRGSPLAAAFFIAFLSSLGASLIFFIGRKQLSLIARIATALIYALSFQGIVFSRWLSNPSLVLFLSVILAFNLKKKFNQINFLIALLSWGLIFHLELAAALFLLPVLIYYLLTNFKKFRPAIILKSGLLLLAVFSPYIAFDLRHEHILVNGLLNFFKATKPIKPNLLTLLKDLYFVGLREFSLSVIPKLPLVAKILFPLGLLCAFAEHRKYISKMVLIWILAPLLFLIPLRTIPMSQTLIHLGPAFYLLLGLTIEKTIGLTKKYWGVILLIFILVSNFVYYLETVPTNENFFFRAYQYTFIGPQKKIIDFIYKEAEEQNFYFDYYTMPYWLPQGWNYLFEYYGKGKYGYLPSEKRTKTFFVIIEPDEVTPKYKEDWYQKMEREGELIKSFSINNLTVEKRTQL